MEKNGWYINMYRQGDVWLKKIEKLPNQLRQKNKILAYGEVTGHHHRFEEDDKHVVVLESDNGQQYVQVLQDTTLIHEEHGKQTIKPGLFAVVMQEEKTLSGEIQRVMD